MTHTLQTSPNELLTIPGVGKSLAKDLQDLGVTNLKELGMSDPQILYDDLVTLRGKQQDRCVLYVFRCAVYFAQTNNPDPELLKWWNWKDNV